MTDAELLKKIKLKAKNCLHADDACDLVYFINNATNAKAFWRNWECKKHHYAGNGPVSHCPECERK